MEKSFTGALSLFSKIRRAYIPLSKQQVFKVKLEQLFVSLLTEVPRTFQTFPIPKAEKHSSTNPFVHNKKISLQNHSWKVYQETDWNDFENSQILWT